MTEPQIPDDLKALYDAALAIRDMPLSGASPEEFELRVHARAQCSLIERIAKAEAERDEAMDGIVDYQVRLWCALGQPLDVEYIEAVKALKARNEEIMKAALETSSAKGERIRELEATVARLTKPVITEYGHGFMRDENEPILSCKQGIGLIEKEIQSLIYHAVFPEADDAEFTRILTREQDALIAARTLGPELRLMGNISA